MASRTLPGIGLTAGYSSGEDGWGAAMNMNLILMSSLTQLTAVDLVDLLPGSAADGEIYLLSAVAAANPGMIAVRDDGLWRFIQPVSGWEAFVTAGGGRYRSTGAGWTALSSAAAIPLFNSGVANYILAVNGAGSGVQWMPPYEPTYEIPVFDAMNIGQQLEVVAGSPDPELQWKTKALSLPAIGANSAGKVAVINAASNALEYVEDGTYIAIAPGHIVTDANMVGRRILGATGNVVIPSGLTRFSTLTIARMSTSEVEIQAGAGVTLNVADGRNSLRSRYSAVSIIRTGVEQYLMFGDVAAT